MLTNVIHKHNYSVAQSRSTTEFMTEKNGKIQLATLKWMGKELVFIYTVLYRALIYFINYYDSNKCTRRLLSGESTKPENA